MDPGEFLGEMHVGLRRGVGSVLQARGDEIGLPWAVDRGTGARAPAGGAEGAVDPRFVPGPAPGRAAHREPGGEGRGGGAAAALAVAVAAPQRQWPWVDIVLAL